MLRDYHVINRLTCQVNTKKIVLDNRCNCSKTKKLDENPKTTCDGFAEKFKTKPDLLILKSIITVYT